MLRAEGHVEAHLYPVWMVWEEAKVARRRINNNYRTMAVIMFQATASGQVGGKAGTTALNEFLEECFNDADD